MLRTYEGIYDRLVTISEKQLAFKLKLEASEIREQLKKLESAGAIEFQLPKEDPQLFFPINRIRAEDIYIDQVNYQERKKQLELRIKKLLVFVTLTTDCRSQFIAHYFGDEKTPPCGSCDNCLDQKKKSVSTKDFELIHEQVKALLQAKPLTTTALLEMLQNYPEEKIWEILDYLQAEQRIEINQQGFISLSP
jgi:ATP-dependent DNA helicase RecQ